jgi:amidophosphoribosyltransferase
MEYSQQSGIPTTSESSRINTSDAPSFPGAEAAGGQGQDQVNPIAEAVRDKRIVLIDDSIVRGTTCPHRKDPARRGGEGNHMRMSAPPFLHPATTERILTRRRCS